MITLMEIQKKKRIIFQILNLKRDEEIKKKNIWIAIRD